MRTVLNYCHVITRVQERKMLPVDLLLIRKEVFTYSLSNISTCIDITCNCESSFCFLVYFNEA